MSGLETFVLGYLVNSLWQVPLVCAAGYGSARLVRRLGPEAEHRVWVAALLIAAILPGLGAAGFGMAWLPHGFGAAGAAAGTVQVTVGAFTQSAGTALDLPPGLRHGATFVYLGFVLFLCGRLAWGLMQSERLRRGSRRVVLTAERETAWRRGCRVFEVSGAEIASTAMIAGPLTLGFRRRVLLVPPGFMETAEASDAEAALAHELAHMRRRDFAKNVLYELVSLPVGYHPMTRWLKAQVRQSRELVCDAMAAEFVTTRENYARSLLRLASLMSNQAQAINVHAIGIFDANILEKRVMSLMTKRRETGGLLRAGFAAACVLVGLATCGSALALRLEVKELPPATAATAGNQPAHVASAIMAGNRLGGENPVYPAQAKADKNTVDGTCKLRAVIDKDGNVSDLQVVQSLRKDYDDAAMKAVKTWHYKPFLLNGRPTAVETTISVTYTLGT
jgi:TonB family protein